MGMFRAVRLAVVGTALAVAAATLSACVGGSPTPLPTYTPTSPSSPGVTDDPTLQPAGSAAANQQYFDFVNQTLFDSDGLSDGRTIIDNLVAAGFTKLDMEVTPDTTSIGQPADSIVFSVRIESDCLIGQFASSGYTGTTAPALGTGGCLVGTTRPIDW